MDDPIIRSAVMMESQKPLLLEKGVRIDSAGLV